jgi:hypothetical protein
MGAWIRTHLGAQRIANLATIGLVLYVVIWAVHPSLVLSGTTIDGGDTGSHVVTALFLRQHWSGLNLTPWDPGWFNGFPLYTYYFVLPDALAAFASYFINYAIAFKLATLLGSLLMPVAAFIMAKLFRAPDPVPAACAGAMLPFLFNPSYTIDGGNLFSTFAGEYAFSLSIALAMITIGLFARGVRTGKGRWISALFLSLTLAAHILPWAFAIIVVVILVVIEVGLGWGVFGDHATRRRRHHGRRAFFFAGSAGIISLALSAWWLLPFATSQQFTTSMAYQNDPTGSLTALFTDYSVGGNTGLALLNASGQLSGSAWVIIGALVAAGFAIFWRDRFGITFTAASLAAAAWYILEPQGTVWNERIIPFWFISNFLLVGWFAGSIALRAARAWTVHTAIRHGFDDVTDESLIAHVRTSHTVVATYIVALAALASTVPGLVPWMASDLGITPGPNQVSDWAAYNYEGYQAQPGWSEFHGIIQTLTTLSDQYGCGRAMWEYSPNESRFGTPEALMTLPYWTNNCIGSEEGLLFESSATTPYHFLDQAELSSSPSEPVRGLHYGPVNVALGVDHLAMLGVKYFFCYSEAVVQQANRDPQLIPVATTKVWSDSGVAWHFYVIKNSQLVTPLSNLPNVITDVNGGVSWLTANQTWWLDITKWDVLYAESGPADWPHHASADYVYKRPAGTTKVSDIVVSSQTLSFHVTNVGVPVVVKISYYPRWHVSGATGPYRVSPNLMVVVPTSRTVVLTYGSSPAVWWGNLLTDIAVLGLLIAAWRARWWRRPLRRAETK